MHIKLGYWQSVPVAGDSESQEGAGFAFPAGRAAAKPAELKVVTWRYITGLRASPRAQRDMRKIAVGRYLEIFR